MESQQLRLIHLVPYLLVEPLWMMPLIASFHHRCLPLLSFLPCTVFLFHTPFISTLLFAMSTWVALTAPKSIFPGPDWLKLSFLHLYSGTKGTLEWTLEKKEPFHVLMWSLWMATGILLLLYILSRVVAVFLLNAGSEKLRGAYLLAKWFDFTEQDH